MKRFYLSLAILLVAAPPASANARSNLEGRWKNGKMEIVIAQCGRALCGTVVKASARQQARAESGSRTNLIGARLIDNIRPAGPGVYHADVFVADRDTNASSTIQQVGPNRLTVRGCVMAVICKTTHWDRIG
ncbi:MAG TPA: DUF2147 domain-containing protein [Sphingomicrobium sp.]|jgi:uncharacterized protein (DUF2147 family)|nr:DUF2147 domain-containing protein [Sphingomicrobium sp.]